MRFTSSYFWGKVNFVLGLLARDIANYSYAQNTSLTQALNPLRPNSLKNISKKTFKKKLKGALLYILKTEDNYIDNDKNMAKLKKILRIIIIISIFLSFN